MADAQEVRLVTGRDIPIRAALQMIAAGIAPSREGPDQEPVGTLLPLGPFTVRVDGYTSEEEFLKTIEQLGATRADAQKHREIFFQKFSLVVPEKLLSRELVAKLSATTALRFGSLQAENDVAVGLAAAWAWYYFDIPEEKAVETFLPILDDPTDEAKARVAEAFAALVRRLRDGERYVSTPPSPGATRMFVVFVSKTPSRGDGTFSDDALIVDAFAQLERAEECIRRLSPDSTYPYHGISVVEMRFYLMGSRTLGEEELIKQLHSGAKDAIEIASGPYEHASEAMADRPRILGKGYRGVITATLTDSDVGKFRRAKELVN